MSDHKSPLPDELILYLVTNLKHYYEHQADLLSTLRSLRLVSKLVSKPSERALFEALPPIAIEIGSEAELLAALRETTALRYCAELCFSQGQTPERPNWEERA